MYSMTGVDTELRPSIISKRGIGDFKHEVSVAGHGSSRRKKPFVIAKQDQVRLGFAVIPQANRSLNANYLLPDKTRQQQYRSSIDARGMTIADRAHLQNFAFNEFDTILLAENSDLNHAVVFVNAEGSSKGLDLHDTATEHIPTDVGLTKPHL